MNEENWVETAKMRKSVKEKIKKKMEEQEKRSSYWKCR